jgi:ATP-binding protein involved in chromosome partitioning
MAAEYNVDYLGGLPLTMAIREQADSGRPTVVADPDGEVAAIYKAVARQVAVKIALKAKDFSAKFPTITVTPDSRGAAPRAGEISCSPRKSFVTLHA